MADEEDCRMTEQLRASKALLPVTRDPAVMGGEPCFRGTRIPVAVLFENLEAGVPLEEILASYPTLERDDVLAVLREANRLIAAHAA
jgi:uncharacterized protein (DUF433 family)